MDRFSHTVRLWIRTGTGLTWNCEGPFPASTFSSVDVQRDTRVYAVGFGVLKTPGPFWVSDLQKNSPWEIRRSFLLDMKNLALVNLPSGFWIENGEKKITCIFPTMLK